jgi:fructokinase
MTAPLIAPLIAGVELGGTKCICLLASGPDDIREEVRIPTTTPEETLGHIEAVLDRWSGYRALGVASFGPVSIDRDATDYGHITATTKAGWSNTDVARRLSARASGVPTGFNSDVAGAALGEGTWGAAQGLADHAYITVGTGVGVGLVMGGRPTSGMTHPELGHIRTTQLPDDTWPGICTYHGACVEGLASGPAIEARTGTSAPHLPLDHPVWDMVAHTLAQLLHTLVLTGIPRRIVMGGGVITGMPHLLPLIRARLVASLGGYGATGLIEPVEQFVVPAALGNNAGPLGAIVLGQRALGFAT